MGGAVGRVDEHAVTPNWAHLTRCIFPSAIGNGQSQIMLFDFPHIADLLARTLGAREADLRAEQAVYGLDSLDELKLQSMLAAGICDSFEVAREVHYPSSAGNKLTHRRRCDMVLSPKGKALKLDAKPAGLFDPPDQTEPGDALWLEVKVAYQFREGGARHGGYGSQWRNAVVADLEKMEQEPAIRHAGLVLVVFTESPVIFDKDVELFEDVLALKGVLAGFRQARTVKILDRMGHKCCSVVVWPTVQR